MSPSGPDGKFALIALHVFTDAHVTGLEEKKVIMKNKIAQKYACFLTIIFILYWYLAFPFESLTSFEKTM